MSTGRMTSQEIVAQVDLSTQAEKFEFVDRLIDNADKHGDRPTASAMRRRLDHLTVPSDG